MHANHKSVISTGLSYQKTIYYYLLSWRLASPRIPSQWLTRCRGLVDYTGWIAWQILSKNKLINLNWNFLANWTMKTMKTVTATNFNEDDERSPLLGPYFYIMMLFIANPQTNKLKSYAK